MLAVEAPPILAEGRKPFVAVTGYGYTEKCTSYVTQLLEGKG